MDVVDAYARVGSYRGAAEICGVDPKTVKRKVLAHERASSMRNGPAGRRCRRTPTGCVMSCSIVSAKRRDEARRSGCCRSARAAGYAGSDRNFRRLVAVGEAAGARRDRPSSASAGGVDAGRDVGDRLGHASRRGCTCSARCSPGRGSGSCGSPVTRPQRRRWRCSPSASRRSAVCPAKVLADRMGCLKGGTVANVVIPTPDYVRFATHYRFSTGLLPSARSGVEGDRREPRRLREDRPRPARDADDLAVSNDGLRRVVRGGQRPTALRDVRGPARAARDRTGVAASSCRCCDPRIGHVEVRKVDKLSTIRVASARYSVPHRLVGRQVECVTFDGQVRIYDIEAASSSPITTSSRLVKQRCSMSTTRHRGGRRHAGREHAPTSSASSSRSASRPRRSSVPAPPPG